MEQSEQLVQIVIPSHLRPDRVLSYVIPNSIICVPESQFSEYALNYDKDRIVTHPDSIIGIAAKRNWIIERYPNVFMIDDDFPGLQTVYEEKNRKLTPEESYEVIQATARVAKDAGAYMFGFSESGNPLHYSPMNPFALSKCPLYGIGILEGSELFIPDELSLSEDIFLGLLNIYKHRFAWIDQRFTYDFSKNAKYGGVSSYRTREKELEQVAMLQQYFGSDIVSWQDSSVGIRKKIKLPF